MEINRITKECAWCGKKFTTAHYPTECCSPECYNKLKHHRDNTFKLRKLKAIDPSLKAHVMKEDLFYVKTCPICGKVFDTVHPQQIYCSSQCKSRRKILSERFDRDLSPEDGTVLPVRKFLRIADACEYLSVSRTTLYRLLRNGYLKSYRIVNVPYVKVEEMDSLLTIKGEPSTVDVLRYSGKYISIREIAEKYGMTRQRVFQILKENRMHHIVSKNMNLYDKEEVKTLFSYLNMDSKNDDRYHWVTADELASEYGMDRNFIYHFTSSYQIPRRVSGRNVFFSADHFRKALKKTSPKTSKETGINHKASKL